MNALFDDNETRGGRYSDPVGAMAEPDGPTFRLEKAYARHQLVGLAAWGECPECGCIGAPGHRCEGGVA